MLFQFVSVSVSTQRRLRLQRWMQTRLLNTCTENQHRTFFEVLSTPNFHLVKIKLIHKSEIAENHVDLGKNALILYCCTQ